MSVVALGAGEVLTDVRRRTLHGASRGTARSASRGLPSVTSGDAYSGAQRRDDRHAFRAAVAGVSRGASRRRLRLVGIVVIAALLLGAWAAVFGGGQATADGPASPLAVSVHTVMSGESLWSISASVTPAGADVRDVLLEIATLNNVVDSHIEPGMSLIIPVDLD